MISQKAILKLIIEYNLKNNSTKSRIGEMRLIIIC